MRRSTVLLPEKYMGLKISLSFCTTIIKCYSTSAPHTVSISTENLLWCCIWSCRRCVSTCSSPICSTRPCHSQRSNRGMGSTRGHSSLNHRDNRHMNEHKMFQILSQPDFPRRKEHSQVPQSEQTSHRPVWKSDRSYRCGWIVTTMIRKILCGIEKGLWVMSILITVLEFNTEELKTPLLNVKHCGQAEMWSQAVVGR